MNRIQMLSLAAMLAGPVHAQVCSGGHAGGMDATGNQCNTPYEVVLAKTSGQNSAPTVMAVSASRKPQAAAAPSVSAKTAKTAAGSEAFCSGGDGGGMDVNGAECGQTLAAAEMSTGARHHVR
jgi:hypothetical protein